MAQKTGDATCTDARLTVPDDATVEMAGAGGLVYRETTEHRGHLGHEVTCERELIGFVNVRSRERMCDELRSRGHDTGAIRQLPHFKR